MTDKQTIIDGCDVNGCEWFYKNDPCKNTCKYFLTPCEWVGIQNCMYKYAKRKEQELTHFKKENERLLQIIVQSQAEIAQKNIDEKNILLMKENMDLQQQLKAKEQECEELKKQLMQKSEIDMFFNTPIEGWSDDPCGICPHKAELEVEKNWHKTADEISKANSEYTAKLKQTLTEIKEIAGGYISYSTNAPAGGYKQILQKISECEVEDESN